MNNNEHILTIGEMAGQINDMRRREASDAYVLGAAHAAFRLADPLADACAKGTRNLSRGIVAPHLDLACCPDTFVTILTSRPSFRYGGFGCDEDAQDLTLDGDAFDILFAIAHKRDEDAAVDVLDNVFRVALTVPNEADAAAQKAYYDAVLKRCRASAAFAKSIGSESARLWLEALRLLQPRMPLDCSVPQRDDTPLGLVAANVTAAYATAERAQARLWADVEFAKLPTKKRK